MKYIKYIIFILVFILSGCWDTREMGDLQIVSAIGIDKIDDQYELSLQIVRAQEFTKISKGESPYIVYSEKGKTIMGAITKISKKVPFSFYLGHIQYVVIGEEVAKDDISKVIDGLLRNENTRSDPLIYIAKDYSAKDIISVLHQITLSSKNSVNETTLSAYTISGEYFITRLIDMERILPLKGKDLSLPVIDIEGPDIEKGFSVNNNTFSQSEVYTVLNGRGLFVKDKLVGYMYDKDLIPLTLTITESHGQIIEFDYNENCSINVVIDDLNQSIKGDFRDGPYINIELELSVLIFEIQCHIDFQNKDDVKKVEKAINKGVIKMYEDSIKMTKSLGSDAFGFGEVLRRTNSKEWKEIKDNWNEIYKTLPIKIQVHTNINYEGPIIKYVESE